MKSSNLKSREKGGEKEESLQDLWDNIESLTYTLT